MLIDDDTVERIHLLWDELADFDAARADDALNHLLAGLCGLADAQNANWVGVVRMADVLPGDPVHGWRPRGIRYLHPSQPVAERVSALTKNLEQGKVDETTVRNVALAGRFRTNLVADLAPEGWFDSDHYHRYYLAAGHADIIWAGVPINADAECYFGIFRDADHPRFTPAECDLVAYVLRGLKWFYRQHMLSRGLMVATAPLTATEREVLGGLLTGLSEKQIAAAQGQSYHTTHGHVAALYRKFGVNNRAALMALWLGKAA